jgi:transcriptional antiterminator NusG
MMVEDPATSAQNEPDSESEATPGAPDESSPDESNAAPDEAEVKEEPRPTAPEKPEPVELELVREGMGWYVLRVASNKEGQVREALDRKVKIEQLEERVGRILVPTQKEKRLRGGTARVYQRKLYPGYVFVEMATEPDGSIPEDVWFMIKETTGVGDFIGSGGKPSPMPMYDVEKMLAATLVPEDTPALANLNFQKGDRVKVREGPFENFEGVVDEINTQKGTVKVIVTIFGRATPIEIEYWQVEQL